MTTKTPESHWNCRVIRKVTEHGTTYAIHEVYYQQGQAYNCTVEPKQVLADTLEELKEYHAILGKALLAPVLDYETLKEVEP